MVSLRDRSIPESIPARFTQVWYTIYRADGQISLGALGSARSVVILARGLSSTLIFKCERDEPARRESGDLGQFKSKCRYTVYRKSGQVSLRALDRYVGRRNDGRRLNTGPRVDALDAHGVTASECS